MISGAAEYDVEVETVDEDIERLLSVGPEDVSAAEELTFARNVIVPLTMACRYTCRACHRIVLVITNVFGASSSETVEPVLTAAVRPEPRDGR